VIEKIIIITSEPFPDGMAGTNRIISFCKGCQIHGYNTQVLCISQYKNNSQSLHNPSNGVYDGIRFSHILKSTLKSRYKVISTFWDYFKNVLLLKFCLQNFNSKTLVIYYSADTLPVLFIRIATAIKRSTFIKE
jgi:hypothetical protein